MIVFRKKSIIIISVLILTIFTFVLCFGAIGNSAVSASNKIKIVLDAGHGGLDGGVTGVNTGVKESELNLIVVKKIEKYLIDAGMNVVLTRNSDAGLYGVVSSTLKRKDMEKRRDIILKAKPNLVVSVHMNKYSLSTRRGAQVFFNENNPDSIILANSIQQNFNAMENCVKKTDALKGDYYILKCTDYPSVIAECGFLSNPEDEKLLITETYQEDIAFTIYKGIVTYLAQTTSNYNT
jgi:N-acetylmuramoyl-L-alanine amidase